MDKKLDLGIEKLLGQNASDNDSKQEQQIDREPTPAQAIPPSQNASISPWKRLAADGQYEELIRLTADSFTPLAGADFAAVEPVERLFARAYWVLAQSHTKTMPTVMLSAPLLGVEVGAKNYPEEIELHALVNNLASQVGITLLKEGAIEDGIEILRRLKTRGKFHENISGDGQIIINNIINSLSKTGDVRVDKRIKSLSGLLESNIAEMNDVRVDRSSSAGFRRLSMLVISLAVMVGIVWVGIDYFVAKQRSEYNFIAPTPEFSFSSDEVSYTEHLPEIPKVTVVKQLDLLMYEIDNKQQQTKQEAKQENNAVAEQTTATKPKEKIDTTQPKESAIQSATPELPIPELPAIDGNAPPLFPDGPPSYPVTVYSPSKFFTVLTKGEVYAKPSFLGEVIFVLNPGDKIEVIESFAGWLKLRSQRGRHGYFRATKARAE